MPGLNEKLVSPILVGTLIKKMSARLFDKSLPMRPPKKMSKIRIESSLSSNSKEKLKFFEL